MQPHHGSNSTASGEGARRKILVVDDDVSLLTLVQRILGNADFDVEASASGLGALDLLSEQPFDVVLSDISMPDLDGLALVRAVKQADPELPIVLITGKPSVDTIMTATGLGVFKYLTKPILPEVLRETMGEAIAASRKGRSARADTGAPVSAPQSPEP